MSKLPLYLTYIWGSFFSILSFSTLLKNYYWAFDVLTHFHIQFFIGLGVCLVLVYMLHSSLFYKTLFTLAFMFNGYLLLSYFWPQAKLTSPNTLRVASINVFTDNTDYQKIFDYLRESKLDVVFLSEIEPPLIKGLQELSDLYPYVYDEAIEGTHGLGFISKIPLEETTIALDGNHRFLKAGLNWQGEAIVIYAAHPHPPLAAHWAKSRNDELAVIQSYIQNESKPHIFLGDFNASPWSTPMQQLFRETTLSHAAKGFGIYPTWRYKTMLLSAPLDHILVSDAWQVVSYRLEPDVGSDHFPIVAELYLQ